MEKHKSQEKKEVITLLSTPEAGKSGKGIKTEEYSDCAFFGGLNPGVSHTAIPVCPSVG